ncbi:MAG: hypothetical protein IT193_06660 [Propionibacteriaceae bacterium]|nr:hypothetical protein [Propionibacteriaceae bacterium]
MIVGVRRAVAGLVVGLVVSLGLAPAAPAGAETPTPTPTAATSPAAKDSDGPDVAGDNSRQVWALGGAGVLALIAAGVVFLRRR